MTRNRNEYSRQFLESLSLWLYEKNENRELSERQEMEILDVLASDGFRFVPSGRSGFWEHHDMDEWDAADMADELIEAELEKANAWRDDCVEVIASDSFASYAINGDASGLEDGEAEQWDSYVEGLGDCVHCEPAGEFVRCEVTNLRGNCQIYYFRK